jgi:hypothetical protein
VVVVSVAVRVDMESVVAGDGEKKESIKKKKRKRRKKETQENVGTFLLYLLPDFSNPDFQIPHELL